MKSPTNASTAFRIDPYREYSFVTEINIMCATTAFSCTADRVCCSRMQFEMIEDQQAIKLATIAASLITEMQVSTKTVAQHARWLGGCALLRFDFW